MLLKHESVCTSTARLLILARVPFLKPVTLPMARFWVAFRSPTKNVDRAVRSAHEGFKTWSAMGGAERGTHLKRSGKNTSQSEP